ncbi:MAG: circularly permuted type 2 ATP-grasp protein [Candidatus Poribacteria bacterium]|nr:circularly permuted type 2 ATP-grasp protein [Candidatus Poribacteria bacterium]
MEIIKDGYANQVLSDSRIFDEMLDKSGDINSHWFPFIKVLNRLGLQEMVTRHQDAARLLRENGVTYVVHGEQQGHRPWELDIIPYIISEPDWNLISSGLLQRASLLNLILKDLYGEQRLIKDGLIPPEVIYAHAGFLRPCNDLTTQIDNPLFMYAADLGRDSCGQFWVLSDRSQAPSGAGFALENRTVLARILPNLFGEVGVHRLSFYFRAMQNRIASLAPKQKDNPHVVVLTPGPYNETYFEHAYLANYLGYRLVQGDDLTVWDGRVWLKSLDGLQQVDVILRRVDDIFCDPLELRQDSHLGVAGLLEVIRQGNVVVLNPPGSSILENPALLPFLPNISKRLIGEELQLPSVKTWWCGKTQHRKYVLENIDKLVIKPIHRPIGSKPTFGSELSDNELNSLRDRINTKPHQYVGQDYIHLSTTPSLIDGKLLPRRSILRNFLFEEKGGYSLMPGGLARCEGEQSDLTVSIHDGGVSKDTWILVSEQEPHISLWTQPKVGPNISEYTQGLSSRSAENLFWVGRYAERAEGHARLLRITLEKIQMGMESTFIGKPFSTKELTEIQDEDLISGTELAYLQSMLRTLTGLTSSHPGNIIKREQEIVSELMSIMLDPKHNGSLVSTLHSLISAAFAVRDRWSTDTWRVMNNIENLCELLNNNMSNYEQSQSQHITSESDERTLQHIQTELDQLMIFLSALSGLNAESMTQTIAWVSLDMGRRIERSLILIMLCRSCFVTGQDEMIEHLLLESILITSESLITYRGRYRSALHLPTVLEMLLLDESNPRSLVYQLKRLQEQIRDLPRENFGYGLSEEEQLILEALTQLQLSNTSQLAEMSEQTLERHGLEKLLVRLAQILIEISDVLTQTYFSHVQGQEQLVTTDLS